MRRGPPRLWPEVPAGVASAAPPISALAADGWHGLLCERCGGGFFAASGSIDAIKPRDERALMRTHEHCEPPPEWVLARKMALAEAVAIIARARRRPGAA